ncbi:scaffolding protein [Gordonia phage Morgana]|uniref:Scaffolding protein n=1 Tax=Gordonia phage Morgana TaxID=3137292 RepID=A0AAX4RCP1_9CAUD
MMNRQKGFTMPDAPNDNPQAPEVTEPAATAPETVENPTDAPASPDADGGADLLADDGRQSYSRGYVERLRREGAKYRTAATEATSKVEEARAAAAAEAREQMARDIAKSLGIVEDETEEVDPDELIRQAEERATEHAQRADATAAELRDLKVSNALRDAAGSHKADTELLLPYLRGKKLLKGLDPTADGFADQVSDIVEQAVKDNPKLLAEVVPVVPDSSGGDPSGGNGTSGAPKGGSRIDAIREKRRERRKKEHGLL